MKGNPIVKGRTINEALGMLPGVININDELRLNGGTVSKIYINGRELHDRTELSSLQATDIENVEFCRKPIYNIMPQQKEESYIYF